VATDCAGADARVVCPNDAFTSSYRREWNAVEYLVRVSVNEAEQSVLAGDGNDGMVLTFDVDFEDW
jgi:hypothetical protein